MQEDKWQDFDLELRSVMQDAEEKAPRGVWAAVSSRLAAPAAAARPWWLLPSFGLAAACAVAALVLLRPAAPGELQIDNSTFNNNIVAEVVSVPAMFAVPAVPSVSAAPADADVPAGEVAANRDTRAGTDGSAAPAPDAVSASPAGSDVPAGVTGNTGNESVARQWAEIERQESLENRLRSRSRTVYAQASVGGNDAASSPVAHMSPGSGVVNGVQEISTSTYGIPFSVGVGFRHYLGTRLSVGAGVSYSLLTRTFEGTYTDAEGSIGGDITHTMHYVGIPLNVFYDIVSTPSGIFNVHVFGGVAGEYCIANTYRIGGTATSRTVKTDVDGLQFSAGLGLGADFRLSDSFGLYIDPSVRYYFPSAHPKNIHSEKPLMVNFEAGVRFNF